MHRANGGVILLAVSVFYVIASFYRLLRYRFYAHFVAVLGVFTGFSLLIYLGFLWALSFEQSELRVWVVIPFVALIPVLLISGFVLRRHVEVYIEHHLGSLGTEGAKGKPIRRVLGAGLIVTGVGIWGFGIIHPFSRTWQVPALAIALYSMLFGVAYLLTGRRFREIDT